MTNEQHIEARWGEAWAAGHSAAFTGERRRNPFPKRDTIRRAEWERGWSDGLESLIHSEAEAEVRQRRASIHLVAQSK